jgi:hypothetical protein
MTDLWKCTGIVGGMEYSVQIPKEDLQLAQVHLNIVS